jgi:probable HAF family extracellular repeat protein
MPTYTYTTIDDPSGRSTSAHGINNAGQIVGQYFSNNAAHGFLYSGGTYTTLDDPSATLNITEAFGINDMARSPGFT